MKQRLGGDSKLHVTDKLGIRFHWQPGLLLCSMKHDYQIMQAELRLRR
jgi:hypothetical protein